LHGGHIGPHGGFCERAAAEFFSQGEWLEKTLFLFLAPPLEQGHRTQTGMHRHRHPQVGIDRFEFLASQPERDVVHALAAVADGEAQAENPQFAHPPQRVGHRLGLAVILFDDRRNFLAGEIAHHLLNHFVFIGKRKIHADSCANYTKPTERLVGFSGYFSTPNFTGDVS